MNTWGKRSRRERATSDVRLNEIGDVVLQIKDHSVIKGHRGEAEQRRAFLEGNSRLDWPHGKHNDLPSTAQDVQAYPVPPAFEFDKDPDEMSAAELRRELVALRRQVAEQPVREEQLYLLGLYKGVGHVLGHNIRTGADWDRDGEILDNGFDDFFHVEVDGD